MKAACERKKETEEQLRRAIMLFRLDIKRNEYFFICTKVSRDETLKRINYAEIVKFTEAFLASSIASAKWWDWEEVGEQMSIFRYVLVQVP